MKRHKSAPEDPYHVKISEGSHARVHAASRAFCFCAKRADVEKIAAMLINDHTDANDKAMSLAKQRHIEVPCKPPQKHVQPAQSLEKATPSADLRKPALVGHLALMALGGYVYA